MYACIATIMLICPRCLCFSSISDVKSKFGEILISFTDPISTFELLISVLCLDQDATRSTTGGNLQFVIN